MDQYIIESKILIIDDQQANIEVLVDLLTLKGYKNIKGLTDSSQSLSLIESYKPDLVLLDLMMPEISGFDVMRQLSEKQLMGYFMPILVLTADITTETKRRALKAGASDFLTKPFDLTEVSIRIKNLLINVYLFHQFYDQNLLLEDKVAARTFELEQTVKALKEIAWRQSHMVRAPLTRLMSLVALLAEGIEDPDYTRKDILDDVQRSLLELDGIIREITEKTTLGA